MSSAKRYNFDQTGCPEEDQDGGYVESSDYDALAAKAERYIQEGISLADQRDALAAELAKVKADRSACWAEFKVMTRACLDAEKKRDALAAECQRLREALTEVMHVMPCLPPAGKLIDGMSARYEAAVKIARTALVGNQGKQ